MQEIIVQNFRAKPDTRMANATEPDLDDLVWTTAVARILFGGAMNIQVPPNLSPGAMSALINAGLNDWGGISPVTPDFVNPEAPWPSSDVVAQETAACGKTLIERLALYPAFARDGQRWLDPGLRTPVLRNIDGDGFARVESWSAGGEEPPPPHVMCLDGTAPRIAAGGELGRILSKASDGEALTEAEIVRLFRVRGTDFIATCAAADRLRASVNADTVSYIVNRNINYTNVCYYRCGFCAFSKPRLGKDPRDLPYDLDLAEIARRTSEAWARGATEVCMQGGIHPAYTGQTYLEICRVVKDAVPAIHVHAFSPLEVWQGAPRQWLEVMEAAHAVGLRTTATIMFGHVDGPRHWARHLLRLRRLQARTGGFTEFVPLPFVHMEAPLYRKGRARKGPTFRESVLMHALARLVLHPHITNIQASWAKMGAHGVEVCLRAGVNDLGGTLMNESISRAAGAGHGQEMRPKDMDALIRSMGRVPAQRTMLYGRAPDSRVATSFGAAPLEPVVHKPMDRCGRGRRVCNRVQAI
jgi:FO synthase